MHEVHHTANTYCACANFELCDLEFSDFTSHSIQPFQSSECLAFWHSHHVYSIQAALFPFFFATATVCTNEKEHSSSHMILDLSYTPRKKKVAGEWEPYIWLTMHIHPENTCHRLIKPTLLSCHNLSATTGSWCNGLSWLVFKLRDSLFTSTVSNSCLLL